MIKINSVLFPTDFSDCSKEALKQAVKICKNFDAKLYILHANIMFNSENLESIEERYPQIDKLVK